MKNMSICSSINCTKLLTNMCFKCKTLYCCFSCQQEDWPRHKLICGISPINQTISTIEEDWPRHKLICGISPINETISSIEEDYFLIHTTIGGRANSFGDLISGNILNHCDIISYNKCDKYDVIILYSYSEFSSSTRGYFSSFETVIIDNHLKIIDRESKIGTIPSFLTTCGKLVDINGKIVSYNKSYYIICECFSDTEIKQDKKKSNILFYDINSKSFIIDNKHIVPSRIGFISQSKDKREYMHKVYSLTEIFPSFIQ